MPTDDHTLPRPFFDDGWSRRQRPQARALWNWHAALYQAYAPALDGDDLEAYFDAQVARATAAEPLDAMPADVTAPAYHACAEAGLPRDQLAAQIRGAQRLHGGVRFRDAADLNEFLDTFVRAHARLLARLAETDGSWQLRYVDELAAGFFWTGRLAHLRHDLEADRLFFPLDDLDLAGVTLEALREGVVTEPVRRLLWKQTIRARDALAQGEPLIHELGRRQRGTLRRWWVGALELLNEIERREYDLWSQPVTLSPFYRFQARLQARLGRSTLR